MNMMNDKYACGACVEAKISCRVNGESAMLLLHCVLAEKERRASRHSWYTRKCDPVPQGSSAGDH